MQSLGFIYPLCLAEQSCTSREVMGFFISLYILFTSFHCCKVLTDFNGRLTGKDPCHITYLFPPKGPAGWDESRSPLVSQWWCHGRSCVVGPPPAAALTEGERQNPTSCASLPESCTKYSSGEFERQPQYVTPDITGTLFLRIIFSSYVQFL